MPVSDVILITASGNTQYAFQLADTAQPHQIQEPAIGPSGPVSYDESNWAQGLQPVEAGIDYVQGKAWYVSSKGADAAFAGQVLVQPQATTISVGSGPAIGSAIKQIDFTPSGGVITSFLIENQRYQHKMTAAAPTWTQAVDLGSGYAAFDAVVQNAQISIGFGSAGTTYSTTGAAWTTGSTNIAAHAFGTLGSNLYRAVRPNTVYAATAISGSWDAGSLIADSSYNINSLVGIEQILCIGKEDGVYSIDNQGTVTPFSPELRTQANSSFASVRASDSFNGDYYFRTLNGLIEISSGSGQKTRVGLDQLSSPDFPTVVIQALTHDDRYEYALCANTGADLMILRRSITEAWHVFYWDGSAGTKQGQHIAISSVLGYPALFFSYYDNVSAYTTKMIRTSAFPNPLQDTNYRYDTSTTGRFRVGRFGSAQAQIVLDQIMIQSRQCAAGVTITPYISADGGSITQFGATAVTSNPSTTIMPATAVTANFIDLYFDVATNSASTTPVLVGYSLKGAYRPNRRKVHTFLIKAERGGRTIRAGQFREAPPEVGADIELLADINTYSTVTDETGLTFQGLVMDVSRATVKPLKASDQPTQAMSVTVWEKTT